MISYPQYFRDDILERSEEEYFVDGGAYIGDTVKEFLKYWKTDNYHIYCWECDGSNIEILNETIKNEEDITIVPFGLWKEESSLRFNELGSGKSYLSEDGVKQIRLNYIDNIHADDKVTFIKMDIEGAEIEALEGAKQTIMKQKPKLAISI